MAHFELSHLLASCGLDPSRTLVMRHRPSEPRLRKVMPFLISERPDLFDAYQATQADQTEASLIKADHVVSLLEQDGGRGVLIGVYAVGGFEFRTIETIKASVPFQQLIELGLEFDHEPSLVKRYFDLQRTEHLAEYIGRLTVQWPGGRRFARWADRNSFPVISIAEESQFGQAMPRWDELVLTWDQLATLPASWRLTLAQWRGIYLITDVGDGKAYVGSAYGAENILGRWQAYAQTGHGGNVELKGRDPKSFNFSILQRVSPDLDAEEVVRLESSWKLRLLTREVGLNAN